MSISYLAEVDTLFVHFGSEAGHYDGIADNERIQVRYDEGGRATGFMVEGLKDVQGWLEFKLADIAAEGV